MGATKYKVIIKKSGVNMNLDARKVKNESTMFLFEAKRYVPEVQSPKEAIGNLTEEKEVQDDNDKKGNWRKKLGLLQEMYINVVHRY